MEFHSDQTKHYSNNISVIIRTKNSGRTLQDCLNNIENQTIKVKEIIIVDSGSTDKTLEIAKQNNCKIIYYPKEVEFIYSKSLNIGIEHATSEFIFVVSSHVILQNQYTIAYLLYFLNGIGPICAVSVGWQRRSTELIKSFKELKWNLVNQSNFKGGGAMSNTTSLFKKELWEECHFNEQIVSAEDQAWAKCFMDTRNYGAVFILDLNVLYLNPYFNEWKMIRQHIIKGRHVYPPLISFRYVMRLLREIIEALIKMKKGRVKFKSKLIYYIIKERLIGLDIPSSSYNDAMH